MSFTIPDGLRQSARRSYPLAISSDCKRDKAHCQHRQHTHVTHDFTEPCTLEHHHAVDAHEIGYGIDPVELLRPLRHALARCKDCRS